MSNTENRGAHGRPWWYRPLWMFAAAWAVASIVIAPLVAMDSMLLGVGSAVVGFVLMFLSILAYSLEPLYEHSGGDTA